VSERVYARERERGFERGRVAEREGKREKVCVYISMHFCISMCLHVCGKKFDETREISSTHVAVSECAYSSLGGKAERRAVFHSNLLPPPPQPPGAGVPPMCRAVQFIRAVAQPPSSTRHPRWFRYLPKSVHVEPQLPAKRHCVPAAEASQGSSQGPHDYRCPARRGAVHFIFSGLCSRL
jgi:hypothetical protein